MRFVYVGPHGVLNSLSTHQELTIPARANGVLIQAVNQPLYVGFGATADNTCMQIPAGLPPTFIPLDPGQTVSLLEVTASALAPYWYVRGD